MHEIPENAQQIDKLKNENAMLREWIREIGARTDTCTYNILGRELCQDCRCYRRHKQDNAGLHSPNDKAHTEGGEITAPITLKTNSMETPIENTTTHSVDVPRIVRLCRFCAQKLDLWMEWKSNHCLYDHATSMPCDECNGANLRNPESIFTVKFRLPNAQALAQPGRNQTPTP